MRHRFHAMCPYFAMFPEVFVQKHLVWTKPGDIVFDPFSGRGTTVFESLLQGREAYGCDVNPVAICISNAKADPPTRRKVFERLNELRANFHESLLQVEHDAFFLACFSKGTLQQLVFLRAQLNWKRSKTDRFISALILGSLHGESHRSSRYFSNRMPRTISTKPDYSVRWWRQRKLTPPDRDVFAILNQMIDYRFESSPPKRRGIVKNSDARRAINAFPQFEGRVAMVITSPPYLDTTNFEEDQWLRLWFLGGPTRPAIRRNGDDRYHAEEKYWDFLTETWAGVGPLLKKNAHIVVRIGGKRLSQEDIDENLTQSLEDGMERRVVLVRARSSSIKDGQLRAFHPGVPGHSEEHDFHFVVGS
jgi:DNA modification methylase